MRILAGIPTRKRDTSGPMADQLAAYCDEVLVISSEATVKAASKRVAIIEQSPDETLRDARNFIIKYAIRHGYDYVIQCDDDIPIKEVVLEAMINCMNDNRSLGRIASCPRQYFFWEDQIHSNKPFHLAPVAPSFNIARVEAVNEAGLYDLHSIDDRDHDAKLWKKGWAIAMLHTTIAETHNPTKLRINRQGDSGGHSTQQRSVMLIEAINEFNKRHSDVATLTVASPEVKTRTFSSRYNWKKLLSFHITRWGEGYMGYKDSKGREL